MTFGNLGEMVGNLRKYSNTSLSCPVCLCNEQNNTRWRSSRHTTSSLRSWSLSCPINLRVPMFYSHTEALTTSIHACLSEFDKTFCKEKSTGLYADPKDCKSFYHCANGVTYWKHCPNGLYFNRTVNVCDWPRNVKCAAAAEDKQDMSKIPGGRVIQIAKKNKCMWQKKKKEEERRRKKKKGEEATEEATRSGDYFNSYCFHLP